MADTATAPAPQKLDDVMLAMDVVDTLRHRDDLVARELNEADREAALLARLRDIYKAQGIEVPDTVLAEGVRALKESRFAYTPPPGGFRRALALLWVRRWRFGPWLAAVIVALVAGLASYHYGVVVPQQEKLARAALELDELLPKALKQGAAEALAVAGTEAARAQIAARLADGDAALRRLDAVGARKAVTDLEALRADLAREYVLRIISRPGESTAVWRIPDRNRGARNYYLLVEAVAPDGSVLRLPILNEETSKTEIVDKWGVRVPEAVFESVRRDKNDDGIVQNNRLGVKRRGTLDIDYAMPVLGGAITRW